MEVRGLWASVCCTQTARPCGGGKTRTSLFLFKQSSSLIPSADSNNLSLNLEYNCMRYKLQRDTYESTNAALPRFFDQACLTRNGDVYNV